MLFLLLLYSIIGLYTSRLSDTSYLYHCIVISGVSHFRKTSVKSYKQITYIFYAPVDVNYSWLFRYDKTKRFRYFQGSDPLQYVLFLARPLQFGYRTLTAKATQTKIIESCLSAPSQVGRWAYIRPHFLDCRISVFPVTCHIRPTISAIVQVDASTRR